MPIDPLAKRFYVITTFGEVGPIGVGEFQELIDQERIQMSDMVRSATGRPLGTVADVLEGRVLSPSQAVPGAQARPAEERRRRSSSGMVPLYEEEPGKRPAVLIWVLGGILAVLILLLITTLIAPEGAKAPPVVVVEKPVLILAPGRVDERGNSEILVRAVAPLAADVDVQVRREDAVDAVKLDPPGGLVTMRAGTTTVVLSLRPDAQVKDQRVRVALAAGSGYQVGSPGSIEVAMTAAAVPFRWDAPTLAWESFSFSAASPHLNNGTGWRSHWEGGSLTGCSDPFPVLAAYPQLPPTQGHALVMRPPGGNRSWRQLQQPIDSGTMWLSCRLQVVELTAGGSDGMCLGLNKGVDYHIGCAIEGGNVKWETAPKRKADGKSTIRPLQAPLLAVLRLEFTAAGVNADTWYDPPAGREPVAEPGLRIKGIPTFAVDSIHLLVSPGCRMRIADLRISRAWQEVVPP